MVALACLLTSLLTDTVCMIVFLMSHSSSKVPAQQVFQLFNRLLQRQWFAWPWPEVSPTWSGGSFSKPLTGATQILHHSLFPKLCQTQTQHTLIHLKCDWKDTRSPWTLKSSCMHNCQGLQYTKLSKTCLVICLQVFIEHFYKDNLTFVTGF